VRPGGGGILALRIATDSAARRASRALVVAAALVVATCLACLGLPGCVVGTVDEGTPLEQEKVDRLAPGMTKGEVLDVLGPPEQFQYPGLLDILASEAEDAAALGASLEARSDVFTYRHVHGDVRAFTLILYTWASLDLRHDHLVVFFDEADRLKFFSMRRDIGPR
jgi:hypothetical protein